MKRTSNNKIDEKMSLKRMEKLLDEQTKVILGAVNERMSVSDFNFSEFRKETNKRFEKIEKAINDLAISLDKFLKRLTDFSDEFEIVKARVQKIEKILRDKLGVNV